MNGMTHAIDAAPDPKFCAFRDAILAEHPEAIVTQRPRLGQYVVVLSRGVQGFCGYYRSHEPNEDLVRRVLTGLSDRGLVQWTFPATYMETHP